VIEGTARALPKRGFVLRGRHPIRVRVLQEIPPESFAGTDPVDLASQVRSQIAAALGEPERPAAQQATA